MQFSEYIPLYLYIILIHIYIYSRNSPIMPPPFQNRSGELHQSWRQTLFQINIKSAERTTNGFLCTYTRRRRRRRRFWTELRSGNIYHARRDPRGRLPRPTSSLSLPSPFYLSFLSCSSVLSKHLRLAVLYLQITYFTHATYVYATIKGIASTLFS